LSSTKSSRRVGPGTDSCLLSTILVPVKFILVVVSARGPQSTTMRFAAKARATPVWPVAPVRSALEARAARARVEGKRADPQHAERSKQRVGHRDAQPAVLCSSYTGATADSPTVTHDSTVLNWSMYAERKDFLSVMRLPPARLDVQETAWYLGCATHDVPVLDAAGLLKPLGHPPPNGVKYHAAATLAQLRDDPQWPARTSDAMV
jgi:hypothetical protein